MNNLSVSFFPVRTTLSALMTTTKSPASRCGVKTGLFFPRKMLATCAARRPSTAPLASITCHLRSAKLTFGKYVFIKPRLRSGEISKQTTQVNSHFRHSHFATQVQKFKVQSLTLKESSNMPKPHRRMGEMGAILRSWAFTRAESSVKNALAEAAREGVPAFGALNLELLLSFELWTLSFPRPAPHPLEESMNL